MYCPNCGKEIPEGGTFCPECGASLTGFEAEKKVPEIINAVGKTLAPTGSVAILVLGIIALELSVLGVPGIILAAIALSKAKKFMAVNGKVWGLAKVGRILAKVAMPIAIVMTFVWIFDIIIYGVVFYQIFNPSTAQSPYVQDIINSNIYW